MPRAKTLAIGIPALLVVGVLGWLTGGWFRLSGWVLWVVRAVLWALGGLVVWLVFKLFRPSAPSPAGRLMPDPVVPLLDQARKRLNAAGVRGRGVLGKLPLLLVLGPRGSAKTTFVQQSGLDAEHLAGNLFSGDMIAPTEVVNVWYYDGHVLVEAGGALAVEPSRWARLVERVQPKKWLPALLGRPQAPRVAIVCFSTEDLVSGAAADAVVPAARNLRDRLAELSDSIGIRLPVYVVFTKADAIPHFTEFVKNLTPEETRELLGTTLRALGDAANASSYAERETNRVRGAFDDLFNALALRRVSVLGRAGSLDGNGAAYEFPREFKKVSQPAIDFLIELCRPSQLRVSPFLRGFYFTGVRPVVVEGQAAAAPEPAASTHGDPSAGATQVFDLRAMQEASRAVVPEAQGQRRVPQWVFLSGILRRVVLGDRVAMGITTSGFGLSVLRRLSLAAGIAVVLFLGVLLVASHHFDAALQDDVRTAVAGVEDLSPPPVGIIGATELERLDALREVTARLSRYENERRPPRSLLFMYTGDDLYPLARRAYFARLRTLMFGRAFEGVREQLATLPTEPTLDEYDRVYGSLKVYVEVTERPDQATGPFFGDVLTRHWAEEETPDSASLALARAQFAFLGSELPHGNPYDEPQNSGAVNTARSFLADNTNEDSFYGSLLAQWNRLPPGVLERDRPETRGYLAGSPEVPGSFTRTGWDSVQGSLAATGDAASLDLHVVGTEFFDRLRARGFDPQTVAPRLGERYERDYRDAWIGFLAQTRLEGRGLQNGAPWLTELGGNRSPIFQMLAYVDSQTAVDRPAVEAPFGALRSLVAPDTVQQLFSEASGRPYLLRIQALAQQVGQLASQPGSPEASQAVRGASSDGLSFVRGIGVDFPTEPAPAQSASAAVTTLLTSPFQWADQQVGQGPQLAANQLAGEFCTLQGNRVLGRYPFQPGGADASLQDVSALLGPGGALQTFFQAAEGTGATLNQTYERFRTRADSIAGAFYRSGGESPGFSFVFQVRSFEGFDRVELNVDGQRREFTRVRQDRERFNWDASRAEQVNLVLQSGDRPAESMSFNGTWAIFELFHQGRWQRVGGSDYRVTWTMPSGTTVTADVSVLGAPILDDDYLSSFSCPRSIAR
jgi:type VI secretion system protein ImpL